MQAAQRERVSESAGFRPALQEKISSIRAIPEALYGMGFTGMFNYERLLYCTVISIFFIRLLAFAQELPVFYDDGVVVTASRRLELASESAFNITVITSDEIRSSQSKNIGDILKGEYGIYSKNKGFIGSECSLSLRGSSYQQVLVLIDGIKLNSPLLGGVDSGDILLNDVERIEVVRGPVSSLYGADAVGGVINIITKKPGKDSKLAYNAKLMEIGTEKLGISYSNDNYMLTLDQDASPGYRQNSDYNSVSISTKIRFGLYAGESSLLCRAYRSDKGIPGSTVYPYASARQTDSNDEAVMSWEIKFDDSSLQAKLFYVQKYELVDFDPGVAPKENYNSFSGGLDLQGNISVAEAHEITCGLDLRRDDCQSTYAGNRSVENGAVFVEDEQIIRQDMKINYGARMDSHSVYGSNINPRIGMLYALNTDTKVRIVYGESFRAPTLNDLYWYSVDPVWGMVMKGSTVLKPEKSRSIEFGLDNRIGESIAVNASIYANQTDNLIQWVDVSGIWMTWEAQNIGRSDSSGIELEMTYQVNSSFRTSCNYTLQQAMNSESGKYLPYKPKDRCNIRFDYSDELGNSTSCIVRYVGERYDNESNTKIVPAYSVIDGKYEKSEGDISYYIGAENIFNEIYEDTFNYPMPGRIYYFGIKYGI